MADPNFPLLLGSTDRLLGQAPSKIILVKLKELMRLTGFFSLL
jgi:hypothetical protein